MENSVQEEAETRHHHGQPQLIAGGDGIGIAHTAARLYGRGDAMASRQAHGVVEGEKPITSQHGTLGLVPSGLKGQLGCRLL